MGNSSNSKNCVEKFDFFQIFWNFGIPSAPVYGDCGTTEWLQKLGVFLETFPPEDANFL